eukprot:TRINITY_DN41751_c0_g1_i1.p1 TRINITY_DN41751_c0_g1~~TRINITY_DN41751_c0_g1_i1.p1  ORF type:complete len:228 (-),score=21.64 TRINITY_DN41751_c0_g1_i1:269-952(-)
MAPSLVAQNVSIARLDWVLDRLREGHLASLHYTFNATLMRRKLTINLGATPGDLIDEFAMDLLGSMKPKLMSASLCDKGHRHSNGSTTCTFYSTEDTKGDDQRHSKTAVESVVNRGVVDNNRMMVDYVENSSAAPSSFKKKVSFADAGVVFVGSPTASCDRECQTELEGTVVASLISALQTAPSLVATYQAQIQELQKRIDEQGDLLRALHGSGRSHWPPDVDRMEQ